MPRGLRAKTAMRVAMRRLLAARPESAGRVVPESALPKAVACTSGEEVRDVPVAQFCSALALGMRSLSAPATAGRAGRNASVVHGCVLPFLLRAQGSKPCASGGRPVVPPPKEGLPPQQPQMGLFGKKKAKVAATDEDAAGEAAAPSDDVAAEDVESEDRKADDASRKPKPKARTGEAKPQQALTSKQVKALREEAEKNTRKPSKGPEGLQLLAAHSGGRGERASWVSRMYDKHVLGMTVADIEDKAMYEPRGAGAGDSARLPPGTRRRSTETSRGDAAAG